MSDDKPPKDSRSRDVHFAFGPDQTFFLNCGDAQFFCTYPSMTTTIRQHRVRQGYFAAFIPTSDVFFLAGKARDGKNWVIYRLLGASEEGDIQAWDRKVEGTASDASGKESSWKLRSKTPDAYYALDNWIKQNWLGQEKPDGYWRNSSLVFGPNRSYYARSPEGCLWNNLPSDLNKKIHEYMPDKGLPQSIALGREGTWVAIWDESYAWELGDHYGDLGEFLAASNITRGGVKHVALHPVTEEYFVHDSNGMLYWHINRDEATMGHFKEVCYWYMQQRAREDGTTFEFRNFRSNGQRPAAQIVISPTTNPNDWEKSKASDARYWMRQRWERRRDFMKLPDTKSILIAVAFGIMTFPIWKRPLMWGVKAFYRQWWTPSGKSHAPMEEKVPPKQ